MNKGFLILFFVLSGTVSTWSQDLIPFYNPVSNDWGYCNRQKEIVIFSQFDEARPFYGTVAVVKESGYYGVVDTRGNLVAACIYSKIFPFSEEYAAVLSKENKIGFINIQGKEMIPCIYEYDEYEEYGFHEGLAYVRSGDKYGYVDHTGKVVINFQYGSTWNFSDGCAYVSGDGKNSFIDPQGKTIVDLSKYEDLEEYSEGLVGVSDGKKWGFVDGK